MVQKENLVDSERCENDSRLVFFYTTEGKERIAKRKIDGERWLDDCVVLFLVRKQYLTIPFGDLNSYNGRQEEKEGGKSGQNVLLDELTNPRLGWIESYRFFANLFSLSSMNFSSEYFAWNYLLIGVRAYFGSKYRFIYFRCRIFI